MDKEQIGNGEERCPEEIRRERPPFTIMENKGILDRRLTIYDKAVLLILCYHADKDERCWPSYRKIAEEIPCGRTAVIESVKQLIKYGYLKKTVRERPGTKEKGSNLYTITWGYSEGGASHVPPSTSHAPGVVRQAARNKIHSEQDSRKGKEEPQPQTFKENNPDPEQIQKKEDPPKNPGQLFPSSTFLQRIYDIAKMCSSHAEEWVRADKEKLFDLQKNLSEQEVFRALKSCLEKGGKLRFFYEDFSKWRGQGSGPPAANAFATVKDVEEWKREYEQTDPEEISRARSNMMARTNEIFNRREQRDQKFLKTG